MTILMLIGMVFLIPWEMFHGRISLKNSVLLLLRVNFVSGLWLELIYIYIDIYIYIYAPHRKYQVKPHSSISMVFIENTFCLYRQNKSPESKVKFRQASICCKSVLEDAKLECATKTKESFPETWLSGLLVNC